MKKIYWAFTLVLLLILGCTTAAQKKFHAITLSGFTQGTYYKVTYYASDTVVTFAEIEAFFADFLQTASLWEKNSIVARINKNEPVTLNKEFIDIFTKAQEIAELSDGAFDITVGNLVNAWGFGVKTGISPSPELIDSLRHFVGYQNIEIKDNIIIKKYPEISINLNAIAKGYSVDLVSQWLQSKGITDFIVDIGGEVRASGYKPDGSLWHVGIEKPSTDDMAARERQEIISITDKSMATSGTYRKYIEKDGIRYSHTIDPRTGYPINHTLLSATVIANDCVTADALATAFMVNGVDWAMAFLKENPQYEGYFVSSNCDDSFQVTYTEGIKKMMR